MKNISVIETLTSSTEMIIQYLWKRIHLLTAML